MAQSSPLRSPAARVGLLLALVSTLLPARASAEEAPTIQVDVRSIAAQRESGDTDPRLDDLRTRLERDFDNYETFRQLDRQTLDLDKGQSDSVSLPGDRRFEVTYHGTVDNLLKLGIDVAGRLSTTVRASPGSTFFQAGLEHEDGILVVAITVRERDDD